mmetsp:Transcript_29933/g.47818  ORF Transcript_29933/g.47818 Transcript_29933/m.47818 type:complete len:109 (+) Transcript_29933:64-390(+)
MLLAKEHEVEQLPDDLIELRQLREKELAKIYHLKRSNEEILEALEAEEDAELRLAIEDNKEAVRLKEERIDEIDTWIRQITTARASLNCGAERSVTAPTLEFPDGLAL